MRRMLLVLVLAVTLLGALAGASLAAPGAGGVDPNGKGGGGGATTGGSSPAAKSPYCSGGSGTAKEGGFKYWGNGSCTF